MRVSVEWSDSSLLGIILLLFFCCSFVYIIIYIIRRIRQKNKKKNGKQNMINLVGGYSVIGKRYNQQDRIFFDQNENIENKEYFLVVCDGMGGMDNGEYASEFIVNHIQLLKKLFPARLRNLNFLKDDIKKLDHFLSKSRGEDDRLLSSGSTFVYAHIRNSEVNFLSIGDSRLYHIKEDYIKQITTDQNYQLELIALAKKGDISYEDVHAHPQKEALINYIGKGDITQFETNEQPLMLSANDIVLLCSDGLTKTLSDDEILAFISKNRSEEAQKLTELLTELVLSKDVDGQDNISVLIYKNVV